MSVFLALREMRRSKGRFIAIVSALSLIVFLVLVLAALADGLFYGATGAIRSSGTGSYALAADSRGSLVRSSLDVDAVNRARGVEGVEAAGPVGVLLTGGSGPEGPLDLAVFGVDPGAPGAPESLLEGRLPQAGEDDVAVADARLREKGVQLGSEITVGDVRVRVVGFASDASFQLQPTLWTTIPTWRAMRESVRPEVRGQPASISAVAVKAPGSDPAVLAASIGNVTVLSQEEVALSIPGVKQQSSTLDSIIVVALGVATLVVALFFALLVLEKRELFAALKALGTPTSRLAAGVVLQALGAAAAAVIIGSLASRAFGLVIPENVPALFRGQTLISIAAFTLAASIVGALFSLRRISRIDPATAIGGTL